MEVASTPSAATIVYPHSEESVCSLHKASDCGCAADVRSAEVEAPVCEIVQRWQPVELQMRTQMTSRFAKSYWRNNLNNILCFPLCVGADTHETRGHNCNSVRMSHDRVAVPTHRSLIPVSASLSRSM
jgi:hypothetical protein